MDRMGRRGFLGLLAAALVLDPERLLWVPGKKVISIANSEVMAAQMAVIRPDLESLMLLSSELWKRIAARTDIGYAHRIPRIPLVPQSGGAFHA